MIEPSNRRTDTVTPLVTFAMITSYRENMLDELTSMIREALTSKDQTQTIMMSLLQIIDYLLADNDYTADTLLRELALNAALMN